MSPDVTMVWVVCLRDVGVTLGWLTGGELLYLSEAGKVQFVVSLLKLAAPCQACAPRTRTGTRGLSAVTGAWARPVSSVRLGWRQEPSLWWLVSDQSASIVTRDILLLLLKPVKTPVTCHTIITGAVKTPERRGGVMTCCCHLLC